MRFSCTRIVGFSIPCITRITTHYVRARYDSSYVEFSITRIMGFSILCITARSREDETRNGHRNAKRNPRWSSQVSVQKAHLKRDMNFDHRGFRFVF